jgi:hypothetical protein
MFSRAEAEKSSVGAARLGACRWERRLPRSARSVSHPTRRLVTATCEAFEAFGSVRVLNASNASDVSKALVRRAQAEAGSTRRHDPVFPAPVPARFQAGAQGRFRAEGRTTVEGPWRES